MSQIKKFEQALNSLKLNNYEEITTELVEEHFLQEFVEKNGNKEILTASKLLIIENLDFINEKLLGNKKTKAEKIIEDIDNDTATDKEILDSIRFFKLENKVRLSKVIVDKTWTKMITSVEEYEKQEVNKHKNRLLYDINNTNRVLHQFNNINYEGAPKITPRTDNIDLTNTISLGKNKLFNKEHINEMKANIKNAVKEEMKDYDNRIEEVQSGIENSKLYNELSSKFNKLKANINNVDSSTEKTFTTTQIQKEEQKSSDVKVEKTESKNTDMFRLIKNYHPGKIYMLHKDGTKHFMISDEFIPADIEVKIVDQYTKQGQKYVRVRVNDENEENMNVYRKKVAHSVSTQENSSVSWFIILLIVIGFIVFISAITSIDFDTLHETFTEFDFDTTIYLQKKW